MLALFSFNLPTSASSLDKPDPKSVDLSKMKQTEAASIFFDPQTNEYYDVYSKGYIDEVYEVEGGEIVRKVDIDEYIKLRKEQEKLTLNPETPLTEEPTYTPDFLYSFAYKEDSNREAYVYGERVSIIQYNPGPGTDTFSISYSYTKGHTFTVSLSSAAKAAVRAGVSYTWTSSASISGTHTMSIPPGYHGYWRFDPKIRISHGTLYTYSPLGQLIDSRRVGVHYPVKRNGQLDGMLVAVKYK